MSNTEKKSTFAGNKKIVRPYCGLSQKIIMTHTHTHTLTLMSLKLDTVHLALTATRTPPLPQTHTHNWRDSAPASWCVCVFL